MNCQGVTQFFYIQAVAQKKDANDEAMDTDSDDDEAEKQVNI